MDLFAILIYFFLLLALELVYFKIANHYNIIDQPNHRSSHTNVTIRGGGVIFSIALLLGGFYYGFEYKYFLVSLFLISWVSFIDDIDSVRRRVRLSCHLIAVALLFYQLGVYNHPVYWVAIGFIGAMGTINAINFMDGINGITGGYGLITLFTVYYINKNVISFTNEGYIILPIIALLIFNFFNFRIKAKCFAGDVGSVSLAFIILFFLLLLIIKTNNLNYLLLLLVYGLDTVTTIIFRLIRKENVFEAHRSHFYQFLVNEKGMSHLWVAALYIIVQAMINIILIIALPPSPVSLILFLIISTIVFVGIRLSMEGPKRLFNINK